jgi:hypothetical protein
LLFYGARSPVNLVSCHEARLKTGRSVQGKRVPAMLEGEDLNAVRLRKFSGLVVKVRVVKHESLEWKRVLE